MGTLVELTQLQKQIVASLRRRKHKQWYRGRGWHRGSEDATQRALDDLVRRTGDELIVKRVGRIDGVDRWVYTLRGYCTTCAQPTPISNSPRCWRKPRLHCRKRCRDIQSRNSNRSAHLRRERNRRRRAQGRVCRYCRARDAETSFVAEDLCAACARQRHRSACPTCGGPYYHNKACNLRPQVRAILGNDSGCLVCYDLTDYDRAVRRREYLRKGKPL